jgi:hypothetical protein
LQAEKKQWMTLIARVLNGLRRHSHQLNNGNRLSIKLHRGRRSRGMFDRVLTPSASGWREVIADIAFRALLLLAGIYQHAAAALRTRKRSESQI